MTTVATQLRDLERAGDLALPLPGSGRTWDRWRGLAALGRRNTVLGRLAEAHCDALAILDELSGPAAEPGQLWGVWAAEPPTPVVEATRQGDQWLLRGHKPWCSGANICDHALVTARVGNGRSLFAVDLTQSAVTPVPNSWHAVGMAESDSGAVTFDGAHAVEVGHPGEYLTRPGFWHGAIGVAACWYGSACAVADPLHKRVRSDRGDEHVAAHLGAVASALHAAGESLRASAEAIDSDPDDNKGLARIRARSVRACVEWAATDVLHRVGRALGAAPLCTDAVHAQRVSDLTVYLRQSHGERDLADLGHDVAGQDEPW